VLAGGHQVVLVQAGQGEQLLLIGGAAGHVDVVRLQTGQ
jgi:hypothetical protein